MKGNTDQIALETARADNGLEQAEREQSEYPDCDTCGKSLDYMPWHYSEGENRHLHACNECWKARDSEPMEHAELHEPMTEEFKAAWRNGLSLDSMEAKWAFVGWQEAAKLYAHPPEQESE